MKCKYCGEEMHNDPKVIASQPHFGCRVEAMRSEVAEASQQVQGDPYSPFPSRFFPPRLKMEVVQKLRTALKGGSKYDEHLPKLSAMLALINAVNAASESGRTVKKQPARPRRKLPNG